MRDDNDRETIMEGDARYYRPCLWTCEKLTPLTREQSLELELEARLKDIEGHRMEISRLQGEVARVERELEELAARQERTRDD